MLGSDNDMNTGGVYLTLKFPTICAYAKSSVDGATLIHPCIFLSVVVSYHYSSWRQLVSTLKARPCSVDQALLLIFQASTDTER